MSGRLPSSGPGARRNRRGGVAAGEPQTGEGGSRQAREGSQLPLAASTRSLCVRFPARHSRRRTDRAADYSSRMLARASPRVSWRRSSASSLVRLAIRWAILAGWLGSTSSRCAMRPVCLRCAESRQAITESTNVHSLRSTKTWECSQAESSAAETGAPCSCRARREGKRSRTRRRAVRVQSSKQERFEPAQRHGRM